MSKISALTAAIVLMFTISSEAANVNPDMGVHMAVGGLYSAISAMTLHAKADENPASLRKYFSDVPMEWPENMKIERVKNDLWAGVSIAKFPSAKKFLASHSTELGISDKAGGDSWTSGDFAWIKAGIVKDGKFEPVTLQAAKGSGKDAEFLFLRRDGRDTWWLANPQLTRKAANELIKRWGITQEDLHRPTGKAVSIYDEVRPAAVRKPDEMNTKRERSFGDNFEQEMGDVIFKPVPKIGGQDNNF